MDRSSATGVRLAGEQLLSAYYNEHDAGAAAWLRELIKAGHIADGYVDERDIRDVTPAQLAGFTQCHFFAGVGVWSHALRKAGWPDTRAVWTGSCPCQPFSQSGKGAGFDDQRHLWPDWFHLIALCRPVAAFGEQVASTDGLAWLDLVLADLEAAQYAVGVIDHSAAGVGAPHIRQRLYFVADADCSRWPPRESGLTSMGHGEAITADSSARVMGHAISTGLERFTRHGDGEAGRAIETRPIAPAGVVGGFWNGAELIYCRDNKYRPVEPGTFPLAHGIAHRVGLLRGYGNALVGETAAEFIRAYESCRD